MSELGRLTQGSRVRGRILAQGNCMNSHSGRRHRLCVGKGIPGMVGAEGEYGKRIRGWRHMEGKGSVE